MARHALALALATTMATGSAGHSPGTSVRVPQVGVGDEATLNANAMDLDARIRIAEKAGVMSRADADRYSRALAGMVRSTKADLLRPPHVITPVKHARYRRTLASVDAALKTINR